jgi:3-isopropylmalate dehydrogenase
MLNLAVIGGDGTGPEVVAEGLKVLDAVAKKLGFEVKTTDFNVSGDRYLERGGDPNKPSIEVVSDEELDELKKFDAIFLGAVGHPDIAPGILEKGLLLKARFYLDQYINLRPVKLYPGVWTPLKDKNPEDIDFVVVRENTEGIYTGRGGVQYPDTPAEVSTQVNCTTAFGAERAIRFAFEYAKRVGRKRVTLVHKTNVLTFAGGTWYRNFMRIGEEYPEIEKDYNHVDACCMWFVKNPEYYDVIVTDNIFGDIITDLAAMVQGGLGVAAGGNINPAGVSMFEPMGGSAPKYTGKNVINPIATIASLAMLLRETGNNKGEQKYIEAGDAVEAAIMKVTPTMESMSAGRMGMSCSECGDAVAAAVNDVN